MVRASMSHLIRAVCNSFYTMLCLSKIEQRTALLLPRATSTTTGNRDSRKYSQPARKRTTLSRLPQDTWDGHMHVVDPKRYPLAAGAVYEPSVHSVWDAVSFENTVGMSNIVLVQPSIYGNDNSAMLDAMRALGPKRSRGVVVFDPSEMTASSLELMHSLGVRGVRLNLASTGAQPDIGAFKTTIQTYAALVKPLGWMVQIYLPMSMLPALESTIRDLEVKICLDHFAQPAISQQDGSQPFDPYTINGFSSLIRLLEEGNTFVKFSAPYRVKLEDRQLDAVAKEILRVRDDRAVFATDWPHTRFEGLDIKPFEERCLEWAEEAGCVERLFSSNAKELWSIEA